MKNIRSFALAGALVGLAAALTAGPAFAKNDKQARHGNAQVAQGGYFDERHRTVTHDFYGAQSAGGKKCPPGLAKKNNGCLPPGQARKWAVGKPLPRDVVYHEVPRPLAAQLGQPPAGHRFVRVASDILLIAIGTGMVIDGLKDLGRM